MGLKIVIIGNNVAGTTLAKAPRDADASVEIDILTAESTPYYPRPRLIDYLEGKVQEKDMLFYPPEWYDKNRVKLMLSSKVDKVDPNAKKIQTKGAWISYDKLVLATGSRSFVPPLEGLPKENVFTLRTMEDAKRIKETAAKSTHAIVIGGGLLGLESARGVCTAFPDLKVTILEYAEHLLMRQLDHEGATLLQARIESTGAKGGTKAETEEIPRNDRVAGGE